MLLIGLFPNKYVKLIALITAMLYYGINGNALAWKKKISKYDNKLETTVIFESFLEDQKRFIFKGLLHVIVIITAILAILYPFFCFLALINLQIPKISDFLYLLKELILYGICK